MSALQKSVALFALSWLGCSDADPPGIVALGSDYNNARPPSMGEPASDGGSRNLPGVTGGSGRPGPMASADAGLIELDAGPVNTPVRSDAGSPYACEVDLDCVIRDIGSCCGYNPRCVNVNAVLPAPSCPPGQAGVCGFPAIDHCECRSNRCASLQDSAQQL